MALATLFLWQKAVIFYRNPLFRAILLKWGVKEIVLKLGSIAKYLEEQKSIHSSTVNAYDKLLRFGGR